MYIYTVYCGFGTSIFICLILQCYVLNIIDKTTEYEFTLPTLHECKEYLHCLQQILSRVDFVVYCISMKERFDSGARKALKAFGELRPQSLFL